MNFQFNHSTQREQDMAYQNEAKETHDIITVAFGEATTFVHPQAGCDHVFLAMLQSPYASTRLVLRHYENRLDEARIIVRRLTAPWIFKKTIRNGARVEKLLTATAEFVRVRGAAVLVAHETGGPDVECGASHLLEAMLLEVQRADQTGHPTNLLMLLNELQIDYRALLASVEAVNRSMVKN